MEPVRVDKRAWLLLTAWFALVAPLAAAPLQQQIDEAQRRRALALNDVTGEEPMAGTIASLVADHDGSRPHQRKRQRAAVQLQRRLNPGQGRGTTQRIQRRPGLLPDLYQRSPQ